MSVFPVLGSVPASFKNQVSDLLNRTPETPNRVENPTTNSEQKVNETSEKTTILVQGKLTKDAGPLKGLKFTHGSIENLFNDYALEKNLLLNEESETPDRVENPTTEQTVNEISEKVTIVQSDLNKDAGPLGFQFTHRSIENLFQLYSSEKTLFEAHKESKEPDSPLCKRNYIDLSNYSEEEKNLDFEKHKKLGTEAFNRQQWQEAIEAFSKAYEIKQDDHHVNSYHALSYFKNGDTDGAYRVLMKKARKE